MFLEYLKSNIYVIAILTVVFSNYLISACSNKSLILVLAICLTKLFFLGLTTERDLLYIFVIIYVGSVTYYSENIKDSQVDLPKFWHQLCKVVVVFTLISLSMYMESRYSIYFLLKSQITFTLTLISILFLPVAMIIRKVRK
jgi:hypothetical protein